MIKTWTLSLNEAPLDFKAIPSTFPHERIKRIMDCHVKSKARQLFYSWMLLFYAFSHEGYDSQFNYIEQSEYGKPYIKDGPNFSISHSNQMIACSISDDYLIGIDIQKELFLPPRFFTPYFSQNDREKLKDQPIKKYNEFWTKKEAVLKAVGCGWSNYMSLQIDVSEDIIKIESQTYYVKSTWMNDDYCISICSNSHEMNNHYFSCSWRDVRDLYFSKHR